VVHLRHVVARGFGDEGTAAHLHRDQPFHRQQLQRLTQRRAADAQLGSQLHLVDPAAGLKQAGEDLLAQAIGHVQVQGAAGQRCAGGRVG
jgi:hypothetical protein